jgi:hypothetical protein
MAMFNDETLSLSLSVLLGCFFALLDDWKCWVRLFLPAYLIWLSESTSEDNEV